MTAPIVRLHVRGQTPVRRVTLAVDAALRDLEAHGSLHEQAVGLDIVRRRLRRDLDRVALAQEWST